MTCHRFGRGEHDQADAAFEEARRIWKIAFANPASESKTWAQAEMSILPKFTNHQQGLAEDRHPWLATAAAMQRLWPQVHDAAQTN